MIELHIQYFCTHQQLLLLTRYIIIFPARWSCWPQSRQKGAPPSDASTSPLSPVPASCCPPLGKCPSPSSDRLCCPRSPNCCIPFPTTSKSLPAALFLQTLFPIILQFQAVQWPPPCTFRFWAKQLLSFSWPWWPFCPRECKATRIGSSLSGCRWGQTLDSPVFRRRRKERHRALPPTQASGSSNLLASLFRPCVLMPSSWYSIAFWSLSLESISARMFALSMRAKACSTFAMGGDWVWLMTSSIASKAAPKFFCLHKHCAFSTWVFRFLTGWDPCLSRVRLY